MRAAIERISNDLRAVARQERPSFSTSEIARACFPSILITGRDLPDGVDEMLLMKGAPVIFYQRRLQPPFQRLAIAHAFAHLIFDRPEGAKLPSAGAAGCPASEVRADEFAAELLAPASLLFELFPDGALADGEGSASFLDGIDSMASLFQVPRWVIRAQLSKSEHCKDV